MGQFYQCHPAELLVYAPDSPPRPRPAPTTNPLRERPEDFPVRLRRLRPVATVEDWPEGVLGLDDD